MDMIAPEDLRTPVSEQAGVIIPQIKLQGDDTVAETLLIALYARALEARQPPPLVRDATASRLVDRIEYDFTRIALHGHDQVTTIMRLRVRLPDSRLLGP